MKYNLGPFANGSLIYKFCIQNEIRVQEKFYEQYGIWYWCAELIEEEAMLFKLSFPALKSYYNENAV